MAVNKLRSQRPWFFGQLRSRVFVGSCVSTLMASCSLRNLDELAKGGVEGGTDNAGGSSSNGGGFAGATAGAGNTTNPNSAGGVSTATGGTTSSPATTTAPVGGVSAGGQAATTAAGGATPAPASCPAANALSGTKIYSYGFESGRGGWEKAAGPAGTVLNDVSVCEGNSYFALDGAMRMGKWDGPAFDFHSIATVGNSYYFSVALRFHPNQTPLGKWMQVTIATYCSKKTEAIFAPLTSVTTAGTEWVRLETLVPFVYKVPSDCGVLTRLMVYFETTLEDAALSVDVDDVHIWEVAGTGTGGAGGGGGVAGAAGSAGVAASAGAGGSG